MPIVALGIAPVISSFIIALSALGLLIFGVFKQEKKSPPIILGAICTLVLAILGLSIDWTNIHQYIPSFLYLADDHFTRFIITLVYFAAIAVLYATYRYLEVEKLGAFEYPIIMLLSVIGMTLYLSSTDLLQFFMGLELQSLAIYIMVAFNHHEAKTSEGALKYFVLGALSTAFTLYGISFVYGYTGSIRFDVITEQLYQFNSLPTGMSLGFILILAGLAFKISAAPFHMWTPDVYEGTPTPVVTFIATAPKLIALAFLIRLIYGPFAAFINDWQLALQVLSVLSITVGVFAALYQTQLKRLLAYSTISHMGYILLSLSCATFKGVQNVLIYLALYLFMTLGIFLSLLHLRRGHTAPHTIADLKGLSKTNPLMAAVIAILMFSFAGIPPFSGFFAKFGIIMAAVDENFTGLALFAVLSSVVAVFYYLRIIKVMYFDPADTDPKAYDCRGSQETGLIIAICLIITIGYIFFPKPLLMYTERAANCLFTG